MMRLRYSDESMIHFRKSKNYLSIDKINFKNNADDVNGLVEVDESIFPIKEESNQPEDQDSFFKSLVDDLKSKNVEEEAKNQES